MGVTFAPKLSELVPSPPSLLDPGICKHSTLAVQTVEQHSVYPQLAVLQYGELAHIHFSYSALTYLSSQAQHHLKDPSPSRITIEPHPSAAPSHRDPPLQSVQQHHNLARRLRQRRVQQIMRLPYHIITRLFLHSVRDQYRTDHG